MSRMACRWALILSSAMALVTAVIRPACGQGPGWQTGFALPEPGQLALAFQPGDAPAKTPLPADILDQPGPLVTPAPTDRVGPSPRVATRSPIIRLAGMPNMFGDSLASCGQLTAYGYSWYEPPLGSVSEPYSEYDYYVEADLPCAAAGPTTKIAENDKAMPMDRLIFMYNHYENALYAAASPIVPYSIDRFIIGAEKTLLGGRCSVEVRMPFNNAYEFTAPDFRLRRGEIGNLGVIYKQLLWMTEISSVAAGLGIDMPTGSDVEGRAGVTDFTLYNDALHLLPFVGFLRAPNDVVFYQGFLQVDVPASSNPVVFGGNDLGKLTEQTLLFVDLSVGRWLWRDPGAYRLKGLAAVLEFHYTTTLQDADAISGYVGSDYLEVSNLYNRTDVSNLTVGLCGELGQTTVRIAGVFPLQDRPDRYFDGEVQLSVNRRF